MPIALLRPSFAAGGEQAVGGSVALARYTLEVSWETHAKGAFVLGLSTLGGADTLAVSPFDTTWVGEYDDLSAMFRGGSVRRGRDDTRVFVLRGEARLVVRDRDGLLNPENAASPLADLLATRYQPGRLRGVHPDGTSYPLFHGFLEQIEWEPLRRVPGAGMATLVFRDLLLWLAEARPIIAATGPTTTGGAIGKILDAIGWINPAARSLAVGDAIPDFSADGTKSALDLISELLAAERGTFFVDGAGVAVYQDRLSRQTSTPVATLAHQMKAAIPAIDHSRLRNRVRVKRTQNEYIATATNAAARTLIGDRDLEEIETPYLVGNTEADALASFVLSELSSPLEPLRDLAIDNRTSSLLRQCLARELGDVVTIQAAAAQIVNPDYRIDSIEHQIMSTRASHTTKWMLSQHQAVSPFRIGTSVLVAPDAEGDVLIY